ncbi:MAG TPA: ferritin-like domain-containing protein [Phormidium sp.]
MENISNSLVLQLSDVVLSPGSYVSTPRLNLHATSFTIATNVLLDSTEHRNIVLGNWSSNRNAYQLLFGIKAGGLPFISLRKDLPTNYSDPIKDLVNLTSNISVAANQWTHVAITFDWGVDYISPTATLYVDGQAAGSVSPKITPDPRIRNLYTLMPSPNSYLIGHKEDGTGKDDWFAGQLKDLRIYTTALTSDAILQLISTTTTKTWTKELVQEHARVAVMVEMYTLPFYLTVLSSIKNPDPVNKLPNSYYSILSICIEEMLHLQLAANLCIALDTQPIFTAPKYDGTPIPYLDPTNPTTGHHKLINVKLDALNETTLDLMLDIETPSGLEEERHPEPGVRAKIERVEDTLEQRWNMTYHLTPQYPYCTIGEMYEALVTGIKVVGEDQFSWKTTNQQSIWKKERFKQIIASFEDAENAIKTISLQGEGTTADEDSYAIPPDYRLGDEDLDSVSFNEYSHYERLLEIRNRERSVEHKFPDVYTATDGAPNQAQQKALQELQSRFANLLTDLDSMWNKGKEPNDSDVNFWKDMCDLLPAAEDCWKAGVVPKWS